MAGPARARTFAARMERKLEKLEAAVQEEGEAILRDLLARMAVRLPRHRFRLNVGMGVREIEISRPGARHWRARNGASAWAPLGDLLHETPLGPWRWLMGWKATDIGAASAQDIGALLVEVRAILIELAEVFHMDIGGPEEFGAE